MRRYATILAGLCLAVSAATSAASAGEQLRLKPVQIMDPSGFERPMMAASSVIPADWTAEGGVIWRQGECNSGSASNWQATAPGEAAGVFLLPNFSWRANNMGMPSGADCVQAAFESSEQALNYFAQQMLGGQVIEVQNEPSLKQMAQQLSAGLATAPGQRGYIDATMGKVAYRYNNKPYEAVVMLFSYHSFLSQPGYGYSPDLHTAAGGTLMLTAFAAEKGRLDEFMPAFDAFGTNYKMDPQYSQRMAQFNAQRSGMMLEASRQRSKALTESFNSSSAALDVWRGSDNDALRRKEIDAIRGEDTFSADTPSGEISLPSGYSSAWQMNDGSFVVTDDQFFNPMDGTRLNPAY